MTSVDISSADRDSIRAAMRRLTPHLTAGSSLPPSHPYASGGPRSKQQVDHPALAEYIAFSAVQHAFDGWAYWGRAVAAEISGDSNVASHLAYYAELRAAKAILASEGIGLSANRVAVVDSDGQCVLKKEPANSHRVLWKALEEWSKGNAQSIVFRLLEPFGHSIADWLEHFPGSSRPVAEDWLRTWGLDLRELANDGSSRNIATYEPSGCPPTEREKSAKTLDHIVRLWRSCEPTGTGVGLALDRLVLRATLETVFQNSHPYRKSARQAPQQYRAKVCLAVDSLSLARSIRRKTVRFLDSRSIPEGMAIFDIAGQTSQARAKTHVNEVLSRALLLLRLATACAHDVLAALPGDPIPLTKHWWESRHVRRGLWPKDLDLHSFSFSDLWDEADEALNTLHTLRQQQNEISTFRLRSADCAASVATLATVERIFLWGSVAA